MSTSADRRFMAMAIELSRSAVRHGNEPFGAVLVGCDGTVLELFENQIYTRGDPTLHAEAGLLRKHFHFQPGADLSGCTLYSSCEPCLMCCGAIRWARVGRLVYGASDRDLCALLGEEGCDCTALAFAGGQGPSVTGGVLRDEALEVLADYFRSHPKG